MATDAGEDAFAPGPGFAIAISTSPEAYTGTAKVAVRVVEDFTSMLLRLPCPLSICATDPGTNPDPSIVTTEVPTATDEGDIAVISGIGLSRVIINSAFSPSGADAVIVT
jgi:hypothetical protein